MARKTRYIIYVDKEYLEDPQALFSATFAHFLKKDEEKKAQGKDSNVDIKVRKQFMSQFMKAHGRREGLKLINEWVQIRDAADFPYRKKPTAGEIASEEEYPGLAEVLDEGEEKKEGGEGENDA